MIKISNIHISFLKTILEAGQGTTRLSNRIALKASKGKRVSFFLCSGGTY